MKRILPLLALVVLPACTYLGIGSDAEKTAMTPPVEAEAAAPAAVPQPTLAVADAWAAVTPKGTKVAAGFFTVANAGADGDRIVAAKSPRAARVELHEVAMAGTKMKMRPLKDGIAVPAGGSVALSKDGLHLMFMDIAAPFAEGDTVPVTLTFERAGDVEVALVVKPLATGGAQH